MTESKPPSPKQVFQQQLDLIANVDQEITLCALDYPMLPGGNIRQMAVVQGYDIPSLLRCARELRTIGFDRCCGDDRKLSLMNDEIT